MYGKELLLDLYGCDTSTFEKKSIVEWLKQLCEIIDMKREDVHFYENPLTGITVVQFIITSAIIIHIPNKSNECYVDIFSCKEYNESIAEYFTRKWFKAKEIQSQIIIRGDMKDGNKD